MALGQLMLDQALTFSGDASTAGSIAQIPDTLNGLYSEFTIYIDFSTGSAAGKITVETATDMSYAGTWAAIGNTIDWAAQTTQKYMSVTGVFKAIRLRISTTVTTGTVKGYIVAAPK